MKKLALLALLPAMATAETPITTFEAGQVLTAASLNENFESLRDTLDALIIEETSGDLAVSIDGQYARAYHGYEWDEVSQDGRLTLDVITSQQYSLRMFFDTKEVLQVRAYYTADDCTGQPYYKLRSETNISDGFDFDDQLKAHDTGAFVANLNGALMRNDTTTIDEVYARSYRDGDQCEKTTKYATAYHYGNANNLLFVYGDEIPAGTYRHGNARIVGPVLMVGQKLLANDVSVTGVAGFPTTVEILTPLAQFGSVQGDSTPVYPEGDQIPFGTVWE